MIRCRVSKARVLGRWSLVVFRSGEAVSCTHYDTWAEAWERAWERVS